MTTQENCVETKKEMNSMNEESDVSNRHMTWWRNAWWVRMDNGPHLQTARGRRRVWRTATRAAREARETEKVAGGEMGTRDNGKKRKQHLTCCLSLSNHSNNSSSSNDRSSKRRNASAVAACIPVNAVDWILMGAVTPVKNREQYDSCWTSFLRCHDQVHRTQHYLSHEEGTDVHDAR